MSRYFSQDSISYRAVEIDSMVNEVKNEADIINISNGAGSKFDDTLGLDSETSSAVGSLIVAATSLFFITVLAFAVFFAWHRWCRGTQQNMKYDDSAEDELSADEELIAKTEQCKAGLVYASIAQIKTLESKLTKLVEAPLAEKNKNRVQTLIISSFVELKAIVSRLKKECRESSIKDVISCKEEAEKTVRSHNIYVYDLQNYYMSYKALAAVGYAPYSSFTEFIKQIRSLCAKKDNVETQFSKIVASRKRAESEIAQYRAQKKILPEALDDLTPRHALVLSASKLLLELKNFFNNSLGTQFCRTLTDEQFSDLLEEERYISLAIEEAKTELLNPLAESVYALSADGEESKAKEASDAIVGVINEKIKSEYSNFDKQVHDSEQCFLSLLKRPLVGTQLYQREEAAIQSLHRVADTFRDYVHGEKPITEEQLEQLAFEHTKALDELKIVEKTLNERGFKTINEALAFAEKVLQEEKKIKNMSCVKDILDIMEPSKDLFCLNSYIEKNTSIVQSIQVDKSINFELLNKGNSFIKK